MTKKVFTSLPMRDRDMTDILEDMQEMVEIASEEFGEPCKHVDSIFDELPPDEVVSDSCWYLGKSIVALSEADIAIFHPEWRTARGCIIEHMVCALYNIPYLDISMDYNLERDNNHIRDYTHDWDFAGEINAELSKRVAEAEGYDDILNDEDVEDALGFEHDDVDDLVESDPDLNPSLVDAYNSMYTDISHDDLSNTSYAKKNDINQVIFDEFDADGVLINSEILEPGEYNADIQP